VHPLSRSRPSRRRVVTPQPVPFFHRLWGTILPRCSTSPRALPCTPRWTTLTAHWPTAGCTTCSGRGRAASSVR
jgi:rluA_subfam: pseudouridine synthase, RluA family